MRLSIWITIRLLFTWQASLSCFLSNQIKKNQERTRETSKKWKRKDRLLRELRLIKCDVISGTKGESEWLVRKPKRPEGEKRRKAHERRNKNIIWQIYTEAWLYISLYRFNLCPGMSARRHFEKDFLWHLINMLQKSKTF